MKAYVDVGRRKAHTVYFPESGQTVKVARLIELMNYAVTAVYVDALFPSVLSDFRELAENGVKVYHLRRLSLLSMSREKHGMEKNDDNDAKLLAGIPLDEFRELTEAQIGLRILTNEYYAIANTLKQVRQKEKIGPNKRLADIRRCLARHRYAVEKEILEEAERTLPQYPLVKESLRLNGVSLTVLLTCVDFEQGFDKVLRQVGRTEHHKRTRRFSRKAMRALNGLATTSVKHGNQRYNAIYQYCMSTLRSKKKALLRVQIWILRDIHYVVEGKPLRDAPNPNG